MGHAAGPALPPRGGVARTKGSVPGGSILPAHTVTAPGRLRPDHLVFGVEARGLQIGRFENGQIVERSGPTDELGIMSQIGAMP